jgi:hypothetical protein
MKNRVAKRLLAGIALTAGLGLVCATPCLGADEHPNQVLEWNQIFIETLIATNTANSSSPRLGAIVHTAIFDAYNGIERRYEPVYVHGSAPRGASRRAAVIAAAYRTLAALFPARASLLEPIYRASLDALSDDGEDGGESRDRGVAWGADVAQAVLAWRLNDGFSTVPDPFFGGTALGQWRPTPRLLPPPPTCGSMSALSLASTSTFVLVSNTQFQPGPPRGLATSTYTDDFNAVKALGRGTGSTRTAEQTALAPFWEGNASVHWNQAANQIARANQLSTSDSSRLLAVLNLAMADTVFTIWSAKRHYGGISTEVTWRPQTAIALADAHGNPNPAPAAEWAPLINTPCHPEYPAGHPSLNGAAATVLLDHFADRQTFTLSTGSTIRTYASISAARSDGDNARVWGGMHYPSSVVVSDGVGAAVARYVNQHSMRRLTEGHPLTP